MNVSDCSADRVCETFRPGIGWHDPATMERANMMVVLTREKKQASVTIQPLKIAR